MEIADLIGEVWKDIPGYENYQVSNYGRVKNIGKNRPIILKKSLAAGKYKVNLYYRRNVYKTLLCTRRKFCRSHLVSRLTCSVFNGQPKENDVVCYKDGNQLNDKADNVYWLSRQESILQHREKYSQPGSSNGMAKLSPEKVIEIRNLKKEGKTNIWLSSQYGVTREHIGRICNNAKWKTI